MSTLDWGEMFPFVSNKCIDYENVHEIMARRVWCQDNIGVQDEAWCMTHTVYRGSRQFRFKNHDDLLLYIMVWE